jgi:hypothetical protein
MQELSAGYFHGASREPFRSTRAYQRAAPIASGFSLAQTDHPRVRAGRRPIAIRAGWEAYEDLCSLRRMSLLVALS